MLSSFRPGRQVLKGGVVQTSGSALARQGPLVVIQFAVLVGLILTTATIYRQTQFALEPVASAARTAARSSRRLHALR